MMKMVFSIIILFLLLLSACAQTIIEPDPRNASLQNQSRDKHSDQGRDFVQVQSNEKKHNVLDDKKASEWIIEKKAGIYRYKGTSEEEDVSVEGYLFDSFKARYNYENSIATVNILFPHDNGNLVEFMKTIEKKGFVMLEADDFDFLEKNILYNPSENIYLWSSGGSIITVSNSVGTSLLEKHLNKNPVSKVKGSFSQGEEILLSFNLEEEIFLVYDDNFYTIKLLDVEDEVFLFEINGEGLGISNKQSLIGGLIVEVKDANPDQGEIKILVKKRVEYYEYLTLEINEQEEIIFGTKTFNMKTFEADAENFKIKIEINNKHEAFAVGDAKNVNGLNVMLSDLMINTIGEDTATSYLEIWI